MTFKVKIFLCVNTQSFYSKCSPNQCFQHKVYVLIISWLNFDFTTLAYNHILYNLIQYDKNFTALGHFPYIINSIYVPTNRIYIYVELLTHSWCSTIYTNILYCALICVLDPGSRSAFRIQIRLMLHKLVQKAKIC